MTATYTFDVFSSLDGYGAASGDWSGYWGKQGPELLDHRLALYGAEQRMVFGATTSRAFAQMLASSTEESDVRDPWVTRMRSMPATVVSTTLEGPLDWPDATLVSGDAVEVVARLKEESDVPLRSHGSLSMNRALMGEPDARRQHPGARLPAHPARLNTNERYTTTAASIIPPGPGIIGRVRRRAVHLGVLFVLASAVALVPTLWVDAQARGALRTVAEVAPAPVAVVFGAGLWTASRRRTWRTGSTWPRGSTRPGASRSCSSPATTAGPTTTSPRRCAPTSCGTASPTTGS